MREILTINSDSLFGGRRTNEFAHFFLCFVLLMNCILATKLADIVLWLTSSKFQLVAIRQCTLSIIAEVLLAKQTL